VNTHQQQQTQQQNPEQRIDEARRKREQDTEDRTEKPPVTDEHKEQAKEMAKSYEDDRPTVTMPDTGGTVSGTAVADWSDDETASKADEAQSDTDKD
jgi:hypothetical protein